MSQKKLSKKFNAYAGKIVNLAEFEATLSELQKDRKSLSGIIAKAKDSLMRFKDPAFGTPWPKIYTADTTEEVEQASNAGKPVRISNDKIYFEASSLMTTLKGRGALSSSFKESVEKSVDHRELLSTLSAAEGSTGLSSYDIDIDHRSGEVNVSASVVPKEGCHQPPGTTWLAMSTIFETGKKPKKFRRG